MRKILTFVLLGIEKIRIEFRLVGTSTVMELSFFLEKKMLEKDKARTRG